MFKVPGRVTRRYLVTMFAACFWLLDAAAAQRGAFAETLKHEGIERRYHVQLPPGFQREQRAPLVFALHGGGGRGLLFERSTSAGTLSAAAAERGMVLVYPEGMNKQWCDGRTEMLKTDKRYDDVGFIAKIIDVMVKNYGIDPTRVYSTGISNGGFMSMRLALELSERIAAVAPVTAQLSTALKDKRPTQSMPMMIVNGTADPLVPYNGGHVRVFKFGRSRGQILSTDATVECFVKHNGCTAAPTTEQVEDKDADDGATVEVTTYRGGEAGSEVVLVKVDGGGHTWPGGKQYARKRFVGTVCRDINASEMILDFFLRHSRPSAGPQ